jgi:hypothetical protein
VVRQWERRLGCGRVGEAAGWRGEDEAGPAHSAFFFVFLVMSKSVLPRVPHNVRVRSVPHGIESEGVVVRRKGNVGVQPVAELGVVQAVVLISADGSGGDQGQS